MIFVKQLSPSRQALISTISTRVYQNYTMYFE